MLLVAIVTGAKATDATFTMSSIFDGTNKTISVTEPVAATVSVPSAMSAANAKEGKLGSDGNYFEVVLTSGKFTAASFNGYINSDKTSKNWAFQFSTDRGETWSTEVTQANDGTKSAHDITVGVTIPTGANGIRIVRRAGSSSFVYSITLDIASDGPEISASNVNIKKDATDAGEIAFTVDAKGTTGVVTAAEEADWLTLGDVDNTNGKVPFTAEANTATSSRSAVVTLTYTYDTNKTATKEVTITQAPDVDGTAIIKATLTSKTGASVTGSIGGTSDVNVSSTTDETGGYKFGGKDQYIGLILASGNTFQTGDVINIHTTTTAQQGTIAIYDDDKATILYNTGVYKTSGTDGALEDIDNKFVLPAAVDGKSTIYICRTNSNNWNGYVDFIEVTRPNATITLNAKGFATYSKATDFEFAGAKAYKMALNESAKTITGTAVTGKIAAGEGILFKGEAGATVSITETTGAEALTGNNLKGTTTASGKATVPTYCYTLSGDTFKKFKGAAFNDNKAYLESTQDLSGQSFEMIFDDQPTAISFVVEDDANVAVAPVKTIKNGQLFIGNYNVAGARIK